MVLAAHYPSPGVIQSFLLFVAFYSFLFSFRNLVSHLIFTIATLGALGCPQLFQLSIAPSRFGLGMLPSVIPSLGAISVKSPEELMVRIWENPQILVRVIVKITLG